jgi:hypothetical protein
MLDAGFEAQAPAPLPVQALVAGRPPEAVADLLPRLFNLCRAAQGRAVRLALGLDDPAAPAPDDLRAEILRDHVLRLAVILPRRLGLEPVPLPEGWQAGGAPLRHALFGPAGSMPLHLDDFLASGTCIAPMLLGVASAFGPGDAVTPALPAVGDASAADPRSAVENSPAIRVADHPTLQALEARTGRGPLWRVVARACDLERLLDGARPQARLVAPGTAQVAATRGLYTVTARVEDGRVAVLDRVTPTDHLRAPGGVLDQALAALPGTKGAVLPLLMDVLDPCTPLIVTERCHA